MGLLDRFLEDLVGIGPNENEEYPPLDLEELKNDRTWGGALMTVKDIHRAFAHADLAYDEPLVLRPDNQENRHLDPVFDHASYMFVDYGETRVPRILFHPEGDGICYGEFMEDLQRKGEENGWDYLYMLQFGYYTRRGNSPLWKSTPFFPSIRRSGRDSNCFIITAERWHDGGGAGIGGAAGL